MRPRLTFGLAALTLLFLVEGLSALFAVLFALGYETVFPRFDFTAVLLTLPLIGALLTPALPFSRWIDRSKALALGAIVAAIARVILCFPGFATQYVGAALTVAAGALFLAKAVGYLDRRNVAAAAASALVADGWLRVAGASWSVGMRPGWLTVQLVLSGAAIALTLVWLRDPRMEEELAYGSTLERRAGGLRLRGAVALATILFLELNVLGSAEVASHWTGQGYAAAAAALTAAGAAAVALMLDVYGPVGRHRPTVLTLVAIVVAGVAAARIDAIPGAVRLGLFATGHAAALLLLGRAVVPASGRRRGWTLAAGNAGLLVLNLLFAFTFFYAFTWPAMRGALIPLVVGACALLAVVLVFMPRPIATGRRPARPIPSLIVVALVTAAAWLVAPREPTLPPLEGRNAVRVATFNVHYGFDEAWLYDPERIARTIEESGADVVALQEVPAGLLAANRTDLGMWLGQRLGMRVLHSPSINDLLGDAILTRVPVIDFESVLLPPETGDRKAVARARLAAGVDTLVVIATHFGLTPAEQAAQVRASLAGLTGRGPMVFMGDLNATDDSDVAHVLRAAGFRDAFEIAGVLAASTAPASRPVARIDWIWLRDAVATDAEVALGGGSDHRLVVATIRPAARVEPDSPLSNRR